MQGKIIEFFEINTDAIATNRGFYYQYLSVLKKWIQNFINEKHIKTFTEVDDDIKEVGNELIFTQIKCYSSTFSLNSLEVKKSIINFFILFLKYDSLKEDISFCFSTNTSISPREKLLSRWINDLELKDTNLLNSCSKKIKEILIKEININKNKRLQKKISETKKQKIKNNCKKIKEYIHKLNIFPFIKSIIWEFKDVSPETSIIQIKDEIHTLLKHSKFENKSPSLLFSVFLSEIFRISQNSKKEKRYVNNEIILKLLTHTDNELKPFIDNRFIKLLRIEIDILKYDVEQIKNTQKAQGLEIKSLKQKPLNELPKNLNLLPDFYSKRIYDWEDFLPKVNSVLTEKKIISIHSEGGMGKTSFAKKYLKNYTDYDHIIWVNVEYSIIESFVLDEVLKKNLHLKLKKNNILEHSFNLLINELNKIDGKNLLIIDIQKCENEISELNLILSITNWQKLILTRSHLTTIPSFKLPRVEYNNAKEIYLSSCKTEEINDCLFKCFFDYIDYNVLVLELTAKTIQNSFDLTLNSFFTSLKEQQLDDDEFNIDININDEVNSIKIFNFIIEKFSLPNLDSMTLFYLNFLVLLPSNNIIIEDLILINGVEKFNENKIAIINIINTLDKKGLVQLSTDRARFSIHKMIQDVAIYNQRKQTNSFFSNIIYISWLTNRIVEGYNNPNKSFRFLKYAESILKSIKSKFRSSIEQTLLLLENELLFSKRFYLGSKNDLNRLIDLVKRAENCSTLEEINLGVMYNNLGLSYSENGDNKIALKQFKNALKIFKKNESKFLEKIIITSNNISNLYLINKDIVNAMTLFKDVKKLRKKYSHYNDQQLSVEYRILAKSYKITGNFIKAIKLLKEGISLHYSLEPLKRNDFHLSAYYNELSNLYLDLENIDKAIYYQEKGIKILEDMELYNSEYLFDMYQIVLHLYKHNSSAHKEKEIFEKIKIFKSY